MGLLRLWLISAAVTLGSIDWSADLDFLQGHGLRVGGRSAPVVQSLDGHEFEENAVVGGQAHIFLAENLEGHEGFGRGEKFQEMGRARAEKLVEFLTVRLHARSAVDDQL